MNWLLIVTVKNISVIYVTAHRCAGKLKKLDLRSGCQGISKGSLTFPSKHRYGATLSTFTPRNQTPPSCSAIE